MRPRAVLKPEAGTCPFEERNLDLTGMVRVGRATAKCKPAKDNAIFDCEVVSRKHAVIWFKNGKFFLKDLRSSKGTYLQGILLSSLNEESPAKEIYSNDSIEFGVDVVDSANKTTHACIISQIKLFYPNGSEASRSTTMFNIYTANILPPYYSYAQSPMRPRAVLKPESRTCPFEERNLDLTGMVRVGRATAKCKPESDNAIFDCQVVSRNHAVMWFENGKFFLKDTRSFKGTYVNHLGRLSFPDRESPAREIHSGDSIEFGCRVYDSLNPCLPRKVTHFSICTKIELFYPNDSEASRSTTMFNIPTANMLPPYYSYTQMIEREQRIYHKLNEIEDVIADAHPIVDLLIDARKTEEELIKQIDNLQTKCDEKTSQSDRLQADLDKSILDHDLQLKLRDASHAEERRQLHAECKERDIEIENLHQQLDRMVRQDHKLMTTSFVFFLIVLAIGGFNMIEMFTRLI